MNYCEKGYQMTSISASPSVSGMQAAQARINVSAHNIANSQTKEFQRQEVIQQTIATGGVTAQIAKAAQAEVSLEKDLVDQLAAKNAFLANLQLFRTQEKMMGTLLDERA